MISYQFVVKPFSFGALPSALALALLAAGCSPAKKYIVVGSENSSEQIIVAEIVAQHLEHSLHEKIDRRLGLGNESILYQAILSGEVTLYPDYAAAIAANILKERPDPDAGIVRERVRAEMRRTAQLDLLDPLGYEATPVAVVSAVDAGKAKVQSLGDLANSPFAWRLGVSYDFQQRADGLAALSAYRIPMAEQTRFMDAAQLFPSLDQGRVNMIVACACDGRLLSKQYAVLSDDKKAFPGYQAQLLVREDALAAGPNLQPALARLSGKIDAAAVRKLTAALDLDHRGPAQVAAEFLAASFH